MLPTVKQHLARAFDALGLNTAALALQRRCASPYFRILYYHDIAPAQVGAFERQLALFREHFEPATPADLHAFLEGGTWPHAKPGLILTFDDGLRSHFEVAAPALEQYGFQGWFFIPIGLLTLPADQQPEAARQHLVLHQHDIERDPRIFLSPEQLRELGRRHVIGCHTSTHVRLATHLQAATLDAEILEAKRSLEAMLGRSVDSFAWVGGEESAYSNAAARRIESAFRYVFTTNTRRIRRTATRLELDRTHIEASFPLPLVRFQLGGFTDLRYARKRRRVARVLSYGREKIGVQIVQPLVPHYRVPFFEGIARLEQLRVRLSVSPEVSGMPPSLPVKGAHVEARHFHREMLGNRAIWQRGLTLDPTLKRGDVLVIDGNPRYLSNVPLLLAARRRGVAIVWWGHGWSATSNITRTRIRLKMMHVADVVLLYTDAERDDLIARGFDPARVFALNNAVDDARIDAAVRAWPAERLAAFRDEHELRDRKVLLFCGRLRETPPTELDVALRALAQLVARSPEYLLAIVGEGPGVTKLHGLAASLGVFGHTKWLGAIYDEAALAPWFMSAQCFVYPGPIGLSLIQALGYGLPVLTHENRREHNPEIAALVEGVTGLTFPRGDDRALAARIESLCTDDLLRARMSQAARDIVADQYSMRGMVQRFARAVTAASQIVAGR